MGYLLRRATNREFNQLKIEKFIAGSKDRRAESINSRRRVGLSL